ncbi:TOBE domain-containing protein [Comamonas faecalis]
MTHKTPHKTLSVWDALGQEQADRRIAVLREIGEGGSISQAARAIGMSYKAAWQALDTLTNLAGVVLVERAVGGAGGGGARLTQAGHELLAAADALHRARRQVLAQAADRPGAATAHAAAAHLLVRTSMRNQWPCTVQSLQLQGQVAHVALQVVGGDGQALALQARITRESAELLGLRPGMALQALCKATAVQATVPAVGAQPLAANHWAGRVTRIARSSQGDEVSAELAPGVVMVGFAPAGTRLRAGSRVVMDAQESSVVLAVVGV